jgi:integrase
VSAPALIPAGRPPGAPVVPQPRPHPRRISADAGRHARPLPPHGEQTVAANKKKEHRKAGEQTLEEELIAKLWARDDNGVFTLDLRGARWDSIRPSNVKRYLTLRNPDAEGWPLQGGTTTDYETAKGWLKKNYVWWLDQRVARGPSHNPTVAEAFEAYFAALAKSHGADHNTYVNRKSAFDCHIKPALGKIDIDALTKKRVREFLEKLKVRKHESGKVVMKPASLGTKNHVRSALLAVWHHAYPDEKGAPPFAKIHLGAKSDSRSRREAARAGNIPEQNRQERAYTTDELLHILAIAWKHDHEVTALPHLSVMYLPNVAAGIAFVCGVGARIEEATFIRWRHITEHAIYIPGTKSHNAPRWVPHQAALEPWLAVLRELAGGNPHPDDFVLQIRRHREDGVPPSHKTWAGRIARIEVAAGLKIPGKNAHILRATHISQAQLRLPVHSVKAYAGHAKPFGGATDAYVDGRAPFLPKSHRKYLHLPTPPQVEKYARCLPPLEKPVRPKRRKGA